MATISITLEDDVYIDPEEWFDNATDKDLEEMYTLCKNHYQRSALKPKPSSIQESEFQDKLKNLQDRYLSLTPEQIKLIMSL